MSQTNKRLVLIRRSLSSSECNFKGSVWLVPLKSKGARIAAVFWGVLFGAIALAILYLEFAFLKIAIRGGYPWFLVILSVLGGLLAVGYFISVVLNQINMLFCKLRFNKKGLALYRNDEKVGSYSWEDIDTIKMNFFDFRVYSLRFKDNKQLVLPYMYSQELGLLLSCILFYYPKLSWQIEFYLRTIMGGE